MKQRKVSVINVGIKASGKAKIERQDVEEVDESESEVEATTSTDELAVKYRKLEESHVVGKYVEDYDAMQNGTFCVIAKRFGTYIIHRYNDSKSLFMFYPDSYVRYIAIKIVTHQYPFVYQK
ncbi:uncharacterized protein TRIADDRAFT_54707 [Trichoplax adhaerens]|uniref:Uncharacterized protein n=1 Tax=Trichoplax adhaerens TaxID=10228 RepID=B3RSS1_TRIAD|nr:hypothetical protein TRIADDRAFT_54707 [Trichoplax adhaerens]EDV26571.1 hypothetical protein TRIADDRAFT_54707 [Trichoplax adhaerens]|eukprot:XP_002110567.1 hypothetical protein TRIADDRAFT_54707 [Trichoplax adhaerens]